MISKRQPQCAHLNRNKQHHMAERFGSISARQLSHRYLITVIIAATLN